MSDLQWLFLIVAILYGWECLCWLRRGSVAFVCWFGKSWRLSHPGTLAGNQRGGFVFAQPLPPLGCFLTSTQFPASLSPDGILLYVATDVNPGGRPAQSGQFLAFDQIRKITANGKKIKVDGRLLFKAPYPHTARLWADALGRLAKLSKAERAGGIEKFLRESFDDRAAEKLWQDYKNCSRKLRLFANVLFVYMFAVMPSMLWFVGLKPSWIGLLLVLLTLTITIAVLFNRAHRALYPEEEEERFTHTLILALSPATTPRAHDTLSRPLLQTFHPLVPARLFLPPTAFQAFAGRILRDVRQPALPVFPGIDAIHAATELYWRNALRKTMEGFLKRNGLDPEKLCAPPEPADESCRAYCPRCLSQFTTVDGTCSDCGGLTLVTFGPARR